MGCLSLSITCINTYIPTGYYWVLLGITQPLFQIFQILKILKCLNDPTCAIFLKRMPNMTVPCIKYEIQKYTNTKCLEYPTCAIFLKSMGFNDIKYDIPMYQIRNT